MANMATDFLSNWGRTWYELSTGREAPSSQKEREKEEKKQVLEAMQRALTFASRLQPPENITDPQVKQQYMTQIKQSPEFKQYMEDVMLITNAGYGPVLKQGMEATKGFNKALKETQKQEFDMGQAQFKNALGFAEKVGRDIELTPQNMPAAQGYFGPTLGQFTGPRIGPEGPTVDNANRTMLRTSEFNKPDTGGEKGFTWKQGPDGKWYRIGPEQSGKFTGKMPTPPKTVDPITKEVDKLRDRQPFLKSKDISPATRLKITNAIKNNDLQALTAAIDEAWQEFQKAREKFGIHNLQNALTPVQ